MQLINSQFQVTFPSPKWISIRFCCNAIGFRRAICIRKLNFSNCDYMHFYQRFNVYICLYLVYNIVNLFHNTLSNPIRLFFKIKYSALLSHFKSKLKVGQKIVFFFVVGMFFDYFCCISVFWQLSIFFSLPCLLNWTPHQVHKQASWLFLCRSKKND